MYLAHLNELNKETRFYIRQSYQDDKGCWLTRDLFDLGPDPERYIIYEGTRGYYFHPDIEEALDSQGVEYSMDQLEEIFWPFLDPDIRRVIENFGGHGRRRSRGRRLSREELSEMQKHLHPFDKRRLCFLRFCQVNMDRMLSRPLPFLNSLLNKSRDEIEQMIWFMELDLKPFFMRGYLYAIFDLPRRFAPKLTRYIPEQQEGDLIDRYFIEEICFLNRDPCYITQGSMPQNVPGLHPYLQKYLFWYFDVFYKGPWLGQGSSPGFRPGYGTGHSSNEHLKAMGLTPEKFVHMSQEEFKSHFRKKAQELHPDKGGEHDAFIALQRAYRILFRRKMT